MASWSPPCKPLSTSGKRGYQGSSIACLQCQEAAKFVEYRSKRLTCLLGEVVVHGAYYRCARCRACQCLGRPMEAAGGHKLSVGAARALGRCACLESFEESADSLYELTGLRLCEEQSRQVAQDVGKDIGERLQNLARGSLGRGPTTSPAVRAPMSASTLPAS